MITRVYYVAAKDVTPEEPMPGYYWTGETPDGKTIIDGPHDSQDDAHASANRFEESAAEQEENTGERDPRSVWADEEFTYCPGFLVGSSLSDKECVAYWNIAGAFVRPGSSGRLTYDMIVEARRISRSTAVKIVDTLIDAGLLTGSSKPDKNGYIPVKLVNPIPKSFDEWDRKRRQSRNPSIRPNEGRCQPVSEPKFTPGPWTDNCQYANQEYCRFDQMTPGRPVRTIYSDKACADVAFVSHCVGEDGEEGYEATARLIAAAPDLYRIVKNLIATRFNTNEAIIEALELLAKIDGLAPALSASESPPPHLLELLAKIDSLTLSGSRPSFVATLPGTREYKPSSE